MRAIVNNKSFFHRNTLRMDTEIADHIHTDSGISPSCDPTIVFRTWYELAKAENVPGVASAMTLGTCTLQGRPSSRIVMCKAVVDEPLSLLFYTNYSTRKSIELAENPFASALFYWPNRKRQVRIEGRVKRLTETENSEISNSLSFHERHGLNLMRIGRGIVDRYQRSSDNANTEQAGKTCSRSTGWGGYLLIADAIELWVSRGGKSHTSCRWTHEQKACWELKNSSP